MAKKAKNFSSKENYNKWVAYGNASGVFQKTPGNTPVEIKGKTKKVVHTKKPK